MLRLPPERDAEADLALGIPGFRFADLFKPEKLAQLHQRFLDQLAGVDPQLAERFAAYRAEPGGLAPPAASDLLVEVARQGRGCAARLFTVEPAHLRWLRAAADQATLFRFKKDFVKWRSAKRKDPPADRACLPAREAELLARGYAVDDELAFARRVMAR